MGTGGPDLIPGNQPSEDVAAAGVRFAVDDVQIAATARQNGTGAADGATRWRRFGVDAQSLDQKGRDPLGRSVPVLGRGDPGQTDGQGTRERPGEEGPLPRTDEAVVSCNSVCTRNERRAVGATSHQMSSEVG